MRQYNLKLKPKKCDLLKSEVEFLSSKGISITTSKASAIKNWPLPSTRKSFLGYANYHRAHVQGYAGITSVLHEIVKPKSTFYWNEQHKEAFEQLKSALNSAPCLAFPKPVGLLESHRDAICFTRHQCLCPCPCPCLCHVHVRVCVRVRTFQTLITLLPCTLFLSPSIIYLGLAWDFFFIYNQFC